jgi:uncharacterized protein with PQ loop repeat
MNNCTHNDNNHQEYFGWIGNSIFIFAQLAQVLHTYRVKKTDDVSYVLEVMWIIGNSMYTAFGYIDNSMSMFYGNLVSLIVSIIQISQKIHYDNKNKNNIHLLAASFKGPNRASYSEIN